MTNRTDDWMNASMTHRKKNTHIYIYTVKRTVSTEQTNRTKELWEPHQHIEYHYENRWCEIVSLRNWKDEKKIYITMITTAVVRTPVYWKSHHKPKRKTFFLTNSNFILLIQSSRKYNIIIKSIAFIIFSMQNGFKSYHVYERF